MPMKWQDVGAGQINLDKQTFLFYFDDEDIKICSLGDKSVERMVANSYWFAQFVLGNIAVRTQRGQKDYAFCNSFYYEFPEDRGYAKKEMNKLFIAGGENEEFVAEVLEMWGVRYSEIQ